MRNTTSGCVQSLTGGSLCTLFGPNTVALQLSGQRPRFDKKTVSPLPPLPPGVPRPEPSQELSVPDFPDHPALSPPPPPCGGGVSGGGTGDQPLAILGDRRLPHGQFTAPEPPFSGKNLLRGHPFNPQPRFPRDVRGSAIQTPATAGPPGGRLPMLRPPLEDPHWQKKPRPGR